MSGEVKFCHLSFNLCVCKNGLSLWPWVFFKQGVSYVHKFLLLSRSWSFAGFSESSGKGKKIYLDINEAKYLHTLPFTYGSPGSLAMTEGGCSPGGVRLESQPGAKVQPPPLFKHL